MAALQQVNIDSLEFVPKNEYILIKPAIIDTEKKSSGGIIMLNTPTGLNRPTSGNVVSVGSDITDIKVGDFVLYPETDGIDIEFNDGEYMILRYKSIIGSKKK